MTINLPTTGEIEVDLATFAGEPQTVGFDLADCELPEGWLECGNEHFCCEECWDDHFDEEQHKRCR